MRVLVACEFSGTVRDAFLAHGHDATSADLYPSQVGGPHYQGDVRDILDKDWDLMVAHPPCTYLAKSGARWLRPNGKIDPERFQQVKEGAGFFNEILAAPINKICVENPYMHKIGRSLLSADPAQSVHPWQFGHMEQKETWLWLKNLPKLQPTNVVFNQMMELPIKEREKIWWSGSKNNRGRKRSVFYTGIAAAMAEQWGVEK